MGNMGDIAVEWSFGCTGLTKYTFRGLCLAAFDDTSWLGSLAQNGGSAERDARHPRGIEEPWVLSSPPPPRSKFTPALWKGSDHFDQATPLPGTFTPNI